MRLRPLAHAALLSATLQACGAPGTAPNQPPAEPQAPVWHWTGVELMGLETLDRAEVLDAIDLDVGGVYETDREGWDALGERLRERFDCAEVLVSAVRFADFRTYLVVDVVERGDEARLEYADAPTGELPLADADVAATYDELEALRRRGFDAGKPAHEMADEGFLDFDDPELHALCLRLCELVPPHRDNLIAVLATDADAGKRGRAATLLNWAGDVADSVARVHAFANDPDVVVRNNVTRFMLHYLDRVESESVRRALAAQLARQLTRPSHADRNKAVYGLLHLVEAWPGDAEGIDEATRETLRTIARDSVLSNVRDPAAELLERIEG